MQKDTFIAVLKDNDPEKMMEYLQNNLSQTTKFIGKILQKIISGSFAFLPHAFNIISVSIFFNSPVEFI